MVNVYRELFFSEKKYIARLAILWQKSRNSFVYNLPFLFYSTSNTIIFYLFIILHSTQPTSFISSLILS